MRLLSRSAVHDDRQTVDRKEEAGQGADEVGPRKSPDNTRHRQNAEDSKNRHRDAPTEGCDLEYLFA